jgi:intracellular sulfur oxidation DsrE/DsrF family protein
MHRRGLMSVTLAAAGSFFALAGTRPAQAASPDKAKVVYHLADADRVNFVLGNIRNHYDGIGGPEHVTIALVVHGPALKAFQVAQANPDLTKRVGEFHKAGLQMYACGNTMKAAKITVADLLPGFVNAEQGGVVRLAELQAQGYVYLRP